jgi:hypothetical protein
MADVPSSKFQKRHRFAVVTTASNSANTYVTSGNFTVAVDGATAATISATSNKLNLAERALPIQNGVLGSFGGAIVQVSVSGLTSAAGNATLGTFVLQGSVDGTNFVDLTAAFFNNPLPQFLRVKFTIGTAAITAGSFNVDVYVNG